MKKKRQTQENRNKYKLARNEYARIRREEEKKFEKDIVNKCKEEPKLFNRYINGKIKQKERITRLKENNETVEDPKEMSEILTKTFRMYSQVKQNSDIHKKEKKAQIVGNKGKQT